MSNNDVPVCEVLISSNGLWAEEIIQDGEIFLAHVCKEVPGKPIDFDCKDHTLYENWGKCLAKLHNAAQSYTPKEHRFTNWEQSLTELNNYSRKEPKEVRLVLSEIKEYYKTRPSFSNNYGLTHGDHREGNVLTDGKLIHIIDFDLPSFNWFMEDVARPFFDSVIWDKPGWSEKLNMYLNGYLSIMPNDSIDMASFSKQIQMKSLEIYLWTKNNWSSEIAPGGGNTKKWLAAIYNKIIDDKWIKNIPN